MKKLLIFVLLVFFMFSITACSGGSEPKPPTEEDNKLAEMLTNKEGEVWQHYIEDDYSLVALEFLPDGTYQYYYCFVEWELHPHVGKWQISDGKLYITYSEDQTGISSIKFEDGKLILKDLNGKNKGKTKTYITVQKPENIVVKE